MAFDPHYYTITVKKITEDGETLFRSRVAELPDVGSYADTYQEAYDLTIDAIETLYADAQERNQPFPTPFVEQEEYSGRITFRPPKWLHERLVIQSTNEGVSLNQYLISIASVHVATQDTLRIVHTNVMQLVDNLTARSISGAHILNMEIGQTGVISSGGHTMLGLPYTHEGRKFMGKHSI